MNESVESKFKHQLKSRNTMALVDDLKPGTQDC